MALESPQLGHGPLRHESPRRDLVEQLSELIVLVGERAHLGESELLDAVERVGAIRRSVDVLAAQLAAEVSERCNVGALAVRHGEKSAAALVASLTGVDLDDARDWVTAGDATAPRYSLFSQALEPQRPELARVFSAGDLTATAAARIAAALDEVERRAPQQVPDAEQILASYGSRVSPRQLCLLCRSLVDHADPDGVEPREEELRRRSGLQVTRTPDGLVRWVVTMHPEAAGFLSTALDARTAPRRTPRFVDSGQEDHDVPEEVDTRSRSQRRLDALVSIARESLENDSGHMAGTSVTMVVTIPLDNLRTGLGAAHISGVEAPISASTARRLAAQAEIIPTILGGPSEPLDLGHPVRLFSSAQRRAAELRDGGCLWPGCTAPPGWCEMAHVNPWAAGGNTDFSNAIMLCPFHHRRFDNDGWSLEVRSGQRCFVPPSSIDAWRRPRWIMPRGITAVA
jgi:hypothetical protein